MKTVKYTLARESVWVARAVSGFGVGLECCASGGSDALEKLRFIVRSSLPDFELIEYERVEQEDE